MAEFKIYYFSGTGNSLQTARNLARRLPGAEVAPLGAWPAGAGRAPDRQTVGLVFPVHFLALPRAVRTFVETADFGTSPAAFAVATHGGDPGNALFELRSLLEARGGRLVQSLDLALGDNSLAVRTPDEILARRRQRVDPALAAFSEAVLGGREFGGPARFRRGAWVLGKTYDRIFDWYFRSREGRADPETCTGCGVCANLCPVSNIRLLQGKAVWGRSCADCFGCVNLCPAQAVHLGRLHPRGPGQQYRADGLRTADLFRPGPRRALP